jgi:hypothetical protein
MTYAVVGRLTLVGGVEVEAALRTLVQEAADRVLTDLDPAHLKALVLGGRYGRGEGGIRVSDGVDSPTSRLRLFLFTVGLGAAARSALASKMNEKLEDLRRRSDLGISLVVVDARAMERDRVRVVWYNLRHGHKLLGGDARFLPGLTRFEAANIDPRTSTRARSPTWS